MNSTKKATSIVEAIVIMFIILVGVTGMYNIYIESTRLSDNTAQRLQAIQIAREGIEAVENIRNTNWILYAADYKNCWNTINYDNDCVGYDSALPETPDNRDTNIPAGSYTVYQHPDSNNQRWFLQQVDPIPSNFDTDYRDDFEVYRDTNNFYTQTGGVTASNKLIGNFTREIQISYPTADRQTDMQVNSLVQWKGRSATPHRVQLDLTLTNWKNKD